MESGTVEIRLQPNQPPIKINAPVEAIGEEHWETRRAISEVLVGMKPLDELPNLGVQPVATKPKPLWYDCFREVFGPDELPSAHLERLLSNGTPVKPEPGAIIVYVDEKGKVPHVGRVNQEDPTKADSRFNVYGLYTHDFQAVPLGYGEKAFCIREPA